MYAVQSGEPVQTSEAGYLAYEAESEHKHEYRQGKVYAMTVYGVRHSVITLSNSTQFHHTRADKAQCIARWL